MTIDQYILPGHPCCLAAHNCHHCYPIFQVCFGHWCGAINRYGCYDTTLHVTALCPSAQVDTTFFAPSSGSALMVPLISMARTNASVDGDCCSEGRGFSNLEAKFFLGKDVRVVSAIQLGPTDKTTSLLATTKFSLSGIGRRHLATQGPPIGGPRKILESW
jgi:hypothetical protein